jgi:hypothetical protein
VIAPACTAAPQIDESHEYTSTPMTTAGLSDGAQSYVNRRPFGASPLAVRSQAIVMGGAGGGGGGGGTYAARVKLPSYAFHDSDVTPLRLLPP